MPLLLTSSPRSAPVDLDARRSASEAAVRAVAHAPVVHVTVALLDALQGSWGTAQELGLVVPRAIAR